ncbi:hypothetical protein MTO96_052326 [Rhipicephalus appendiculatus]
MCVLFSSVSVPRTSSHTADLNLEKPPESTEQAEAPPVNISFEEDVFFCAAEIQKKTNDANEDDIKQVTGAFMQAVAASSQKQPTHRCTSFFDFMAESAKELTPFKQDRLKHACHMALLEIKEV